MIVELIFKLLFLIPNMVISLTPAIPLINTAGNFAGLLELLAIGNQFFPVGQITTYALIWLALQVVALFKFAVDWLLSLIPMY